AALYAAKNGHEVVLIEQDKLGGTCLNCGCIPTKALLACSDLLHDIRNAGAFGIAINEEPQTRFEDMYKRKEGIVSGLVNGIRFLMNANHVTVVNGYGRLAGPGTIAVTREDGETETITADRIILATGSSESVPPVFPYDGTGVITSKEVLAITERPGSMIIVGGGVIGCEVGQFFARIGTNVTIVEMMDHILPNEDADVAKILARALKKDGVKILCGKAVETVQYTEDGIMVAVSGGELLLAEKVLIAIGRRPNTADIGLETVGIKTDRRGYIPVDAHMRTEAAGIYAIGDIVPTAQLAHVASKEGLTAVDDICGKPEAYTTYHAVPRCIYADPEIAAVGVTEDACKKEGRSFRKGTFDFMASGKAKAAGKTEGMVKVLTDEADVIIGASITGAHASDMLSVLTLAVELGLTTEQVNRSIFPHPSMSESIMEALHDVHGSSVHKL
ncbi:MAG: dihydrolipoyl dehydrogenase, partial [Eubacterium sp.]|nr:dihydrolipoyl dehydrogenase [Eubacterium sp.]